jgi:hypothetical protein
VLKRSVEGLLWKSWFDGRCSFRERQVALEPR